MTINSLSDVSEFPLCWPEGKPRAAQRITPGKRDPFHNPGLARALQKIDDEMRRVGARGFVVSMSPRHKFGSPDPGVAVWWNDKPRTPSAPAQLKVLACDQFHDAAANLYAIGLSIDRLRALERYGAYTIDQALEGAKLALPAPADANDIDWRAVFGDVIQGLADEDALAIINTRYRRMAAEANGDEAELRRLNLAIEKARQQFKAA